MGRGDGGGVSAAVVVEMAQVVEVMEQEVVVMAAAAVVMAAAVVAQSRPPPGCPLSGTWSYLPDGEIHLWNMSQAGEIACFTGQSSWNGATGSLVGYNLTLRFGVLDKGPPIIK